MASTRILGLSHRAARIAVALALMMMVTGTALVVDAYDRVGATTAYPVVVTVEDPTNLTCSDIASLLVQEGIYATAPTFQSYKVDPPKEVSDAGPAGLTITDLQNADDGTVSFDWSTAVPVDVVYVKSGLGASHVYVYDPATGATSGTGLTTEGGKQISHIDICWSTHETTTVPETTPTTPTTEPTTATTAPTTPTTPVVTTAPAASVSPASEVEVLGVTQVEVSGELPYTGPYVGVPLVVAGLLLGLGSGLALTAHLRRGDES